MKDDKKVEIVRKTRKRVALFDIRIFELSKVCSFEENINKGNGEGRG